VLKLEAVAVQDLRGAVLLALAELLQTREKAGIEDELRRDPVVGVALLVTGKDDDLGPVLAQHLDDPGLILAGVEDSAVGELAVHADGGTQDPRGLLAFGLALGRGAERSHLALSQIAGSDLVSLLHHPQEKTAD